MTLAIITDIENIPDEIKAWLGTSPVVKTVETDVENVAVAGWNYIKANGLTDAYNIALGLLTGAAAGASWTTLLSTLKTDVTTAGTSLASGAESVVLGQAQADLIAAGKLIAPSTGTTLAATTAAA